ncbi:MAG: hypothetical protein R2688_06095 [Fimbriimonadaceae bacterium]
MPAQIIFDTAQQRVRADRLTVAAAGDEWNGPIWQNTWIDPLTKTLMLRPQPLSANWYVEDTGANAKLSLSDFVATGQWEERADQHWKGPWIGLVDSAGSGTLLTTQSFAKNRGMSLSWFSYGTGDVYLQLKCGWNTSADDGAGVALHIWSDGSIDIYREGALVGQDRVSGTKLPEVRSHQVFELMLLPGRRRELMVFSRNGGGFVHVFEDIESDDPDPEITPAGSFWMEANSGAMQVQIAPLRFASSGHATSLQTSFLEPPDSGETLETPRAFFDPGFGLGTQAITIDLREQDGTTAFVPDGVKNQIRMRAELSTTDDGYTPFLYGAQASFPPILATTDGATELDVTGRTLDAVMSIPDSPRGVTLDLNLRGEGVTDPLQADVAGHHPVALRSGTTTWLEGRSLPPEVDYAASDRAVRLQIEVRDAWAALEEAVFAERFPLDGLTMSEALEVLVIRAGVDQFAISATPNPLPSGIPRECGNWSLLIEPGDTAAEWVVRLMETFAATWWYGFRPKADGSETEFYAISPDDLPTTPETMLYGTVGDAVSLGGLTEDQALTRTIREFHEVTLEPVATEVRVTGIDAQSQRPIQTVKTDYQAQNVSLPVASRPVNWVGEIRRYGLVDPSLTNQTAVDDACANLFDALTRRRIYAEFESELLLNSFGVPLWRGDVIAIQGKGDWRIRSFGFRMELESDEMVWRPAHYTAEKIQ